MKWYKVADVGSLKTAVIKVEPGGKKVCLVNNEGVYYALASKCPHAGADLSTGWCEKGKLICPFHRYAYDLETGRGDAGQNDYVTTYPVELRGIEIYVGIPSFWEQFTTTQR